MMNMVELKARVEDMVKQHKAKRHGSEPYGDARVDLDTFWSYSREKMLAPEIRVGEFGTASGRIRIRNESMITVSVSGEFEDFAILLDILKKAATEYSSSRKNGELS